MYGENLPSATVKHMDQSIIHYNDVNSSLAFKISCRY